MEQSRNWNSRSKPFVTHEIRVIVEDNWLIIVDKDLKNERN